MFNGCIGFLLVFILFFLFVFANEYHGCKSTLIYIIDVWQSRNLMFLFPAFRPFIDLASKFRKKSLNSEYCSSTDSFIRTLPLLQPSTSPQLCNPQISIRWCNHSSKCIYPVYQINQRLFRCSAWLQLMKCMLLVYVSRLNFEKCTEFQQNKLCGEKLI